MEDKLRWKVRRFFTGKHPINFIKSERYRFKYGVSYWDVMDYDTYIAKKIVKHLKFYKKTNAEIGGYPSDILGDGSVRAIGENDSEGLEEWNHILDKMIWSFEAISDKGKAEDEMYEDAPDRGDWLVIDLVVQPPPEEYTEWMRTVFFPRMKAHNEKIQEGLDLFAKYFRNLWI